MSIFSKIGDTLGFGDGDDVAHMPELTGVLKADIQKVRDRKKEKIENLGMQSEVQLAERAALGGKLQDSERENQARAFAQAQQQGLTDGGGGEAATRSAIKSAGLFGSENQGKIMGVGADIVSRDFAGQQAVKDRALFTTPSLAAIPLEMDVKRQAANFQADAVNDANRGSGLARFGQVAGTIAGGIFGGPGGAAAGGAAGSMAGRQIGRNA